MLAVLMILLSLIQTNNSVLSLVARTESSRFSFVMSQKKKKKLLSDVIVLAGNHR